MASCKPQVVILLLVVALAGAVGGAAAQGCGKTRKITVQNLSSRDLPLSLTLFQGSPPLFGAGYVLRRGTHAEFPVCKWTGRVLAPGAPVAEFHVGDDGGVWYQVSNKPAAGEQLRVSMTPHGSPLQGRCPVAGCADHGRCYPDSAVYGGNCRNADELKIIFYSA